MFFISSSIGLSVFPQDGSGARQLLANADMAMYRVKQDGRNGFSFYHTDMNTDVQRTLGLDGRQHQAIATLGLVSPDEFIPLAEKNGLIPQLGEFVINTACMQAAQWQKISPLHISINFSSVQLRYWLFGAELFAEVSI